MLIRHFFSASRVPNRRLHGRDQLGSSMCLVFGFHFSTAKSRVHADFLLFFLSSTSVNSASTIFSLPDGGAAADESCGCAYTASPRLVATCCSAAAFVVISVASLPFKAA